MLTQIAILGPGLLGASVMQAARERGLAGRITAWSRRAETRAACEGKSWCDAVFASPADCVRDADLVVVCVPPDKIVETLEAIAPALKPGALVTDVGSTKGEICRRAQTALAAAPEAVFVGAHPMAGSEKSGSENASPALFENKICFITPLPETPAPAVKIVSGFWKNLGMRIVEKTPETHDEIVAGISHLPHLIASTLALTLAQKNDDRQNFSGSGLRDTTRVAGGDPELWISIFKENRDAVLEALDNFRHELETTTNALKNADFDTVKTRLKTGKNWRDALMKNL